MILSTTVNSFTGQFLYSDAAYTVQGVTRRIAQPIDQRPLLNRITAIPILGHLGAAIRITLAAIHMLGHLFAALLFWEKGHLYHVAKGGAELLKGLIEIIPIAGRLFAWNIDAGPYLTPASRVSRTRVSFFIIRISNPDKNDPIDRELKRNGWGFFPR